MESYSILMSSMDEVGGDDNNDSDDQLSEFLMDDLHCNRASTAPAKPLSDLGRFKREKEFTVLEQFVITANQMIHKSYEKYDLDSDEGQKIFKRYLMHIESLCEHYKVETRSRDYRQTFSNSYKVLYKEGSLCYLTEIWDSAQEAFPYLWVNGQKFTFSAQVLQTGTRLVSEHFKLQHILKNAYSKICEEANETLESIKKEIAMTLQDFDNVWTRYQETYITELMNIEKEARKLIVKSIELEHMLTSIEVRQRLKGRLPTKIQQYRHIRNQLIQILCKINAVANSEGKGRDDLDHQILQQAEGIIRKVTEQQSQGVRLLAEKIRAVFSKFRNLLRKYQNNIENVDPQLRNNPDLVQLLLDYENSWQKGKNYFLVPLKCKFLIHFSYIIEVASQKYTDFRQQLQALDVNLFLSIPCLLILKNLDNQDKQICQFFLPYVLQQTSKSHKMYKSLRQDFSQWKASSPDNFLYYNVLQKQLIGIQCIEPELNLKKQFKGFDEMINKIKYISMEMQRCCPIEWNNLLDAALSLPSN